MVQGLDPRVTTNKGPAVHRQSVSIDNRPLTPQPWQDQCVIDQALLRQFNVILIERSTAEAKAFVVTETQSKPRKVNLLHWLKVMEDYTTRKQGTPGEPSHHLLHATQAQRRKRSASSHSSPSIKRLRSGQHALQTAKTDVEEDCVSVEEDELDATMVHEKATFQQDIEVSCVEEYYTQALGLLGQLGCKDILKAWIKHGHPKKQSKYPYNGGDTRLNSMVKHDFQGAYKAPDYWPEQEGWENGTGCRHREPDHIYKPERLHCMRHILRSNYQLPGEIDLTLEKLRSATVQIENDVPKNFTPRTIRILRQIYNARAKEIRYEKGEIDGNVTVRFTLPKPSVKARKPSRQTHSVYVSKKRSQQSRWKRNMRSLPTAHMGSNSQIEGLQTINKRADRDFKQDLGTSTFGNTPTSTIPSVTPDASSPKSTLNGTLSSKADMPTSNFPAPVSSQNQIDGESSGAHLCYQQGSTCLASVDLIGDFPFEISSRAPQNQGSLHHKDTNAASFTQISQSSRRGAHFVPSNESHGLYKKYHNQQGYQQARTFQQTCYNLDGPSTSTQPVDQLRRQFALEATSFSGSSSGLAGLCQGHSQLGTEPRGMKDPMLTDVADSGAVSQSSAQAVNNPFSSDAFGSSFTECSFGSGLQAYNWPPQTFLPQTQPTQQAFEADIQQRYPTYISSTLNTLSPDP